MGSFLDQNSYCSRSTARFADRRAVHEIGGSSWKSMSRQARVRTHGHELNQR
jgi:hypothetical protein